jgi:hypothetical protein
MFVTVFRKAHIRPYPELDESNPHHALLLSDRFILILSSHLRTVSHVVSKGSYALMWTDPIEPDDWLL